MYKITIKGKASTSNPIKDCDGISCQDNFSEYFDEGLVGDSVTDSRGTSLGDDPFGSFPIADEKADDPFVTNDLPF